LLAPPLPGFARVEPANAQAPVVSLGLIEITLPDGARMRVDAKVDERTLHGACSRCFVPSQLRVKLIRRPRLGCPAWEGAVVQASVPERPIEPDSFKLPHIRN
jgi:hypothetical protein